MKIAINTRPLSTGHKNRGIGIYTKNLIENLKELDKSNEYVYFEKEQELTSVDVVHYPFFDPFFLTLPKKNKFPTVVTVHDLTPIIFSKAYPRGLKGEVKWQIQKRSLKKVDRIITDSQSSKKDIEKIINFDPDKISVVYLAPSLEFKTLTGSDWALKTKNKFNIGNNFILYVGDVNYNKNLSGLFEAFSKIEDKNLDLILVGESFTNPAVFSQKQIPENLKNNVKILGLVPTDDLVKLYNLATILCLPSFYEGFGLTIVEAFACSCPVICSNVSSLPEIGGDAAIYFDPEKTEELTDKINLISSMKKSDYENLKIRSFEESKKFSWKKTALDTLKVYEQIQQQQKKLND